MVNLVFSIIFGLMLTIPVSAAQVTANFIVPFDPVTRQTTLPKDKDGQPVKADWWHLTREKGNTVVIQVRAEQVIIDAMKADSASKAPTYRFIEDKTSDPLAVKEIQAVPEATKTFLTKSIPLETLLKQDWSTPEKGVEAVVKCFEGKIVDYNTGGVGTTLETITEKEVVK